MRNPWRGSPRLRAAGFTLIELFVVIALVGLLATLVIGSYQTYIPRFQLRSAMEGTAQVIARARLTAIQRGITTVVVADFQRRTVYAYGEINGDPANPEDPNGRYLVFDPVPGSPGMILGAEESLTYDTDFLISYFQLPGPPQAGVDFAGPVNGVQGADSVIGLTSVAGAGADDPGVLVFTSSGKVLDTGAIRLVDVRRANYMEAWIPSIAGRVSLRKYLLDDDAPTGAADFFAEGNTMRADGTVGRNVWVWY
jgi:prepilin-type N-terminal cleavage/methylation domain-containing protein